MEGEKEIVLRTEEVNEILTSTPKWILRWGISVVFILIVVGVGLSYFIRYPDILTAEITLTTLNPPVKLLSKSTGKVTELLVKNSQLVKANAPLAIIENTADFNDVLYLDTLCKSLLNKLNIMDTLPEIILKSNLKVGDMTPAYLMYIKSVKDLFLYKNINPYKKQIALLQKDLLNYNSLLGKYRHQESINSQQLALAEMDYNRDKNLFNEKVITAREFENKKKDYLSALSSNEAIKITVSNALIQINSIEKSILQLQLQDYQEQTKFKNDLQHNLKSLLGEISKWKQLYLIQSPVDGKISFLTAWVANQNIQAGDALFAVIPMHKQHYVGKCTLPTLNSGKLHTGQKVNIKLSNYPYTENGMLQGSVYSISEVPLKDSYAVDVILNNGLISSYNKTLTFKEEMKGTAEIITQNLSVMDRVFFSFRKLIYR